MRHEEKRKRLEKIMVVREFLASMMSIEEGFRFFVSEKNRYQRRKWWNGGFLEMMIEDVSPSGDIYVLIIVFPRPSKGKSLPFSENVYYFYTVKEEVIIRELFVSLKMDKGITNNSNEKEKGEAVINEMICAISRIFSRKGNL